MIDVFKVGVALSFTSNGPEVLGILLRDLAGVGNAVTALRGNFDGLKTAVAGALAFGAGVGMIKGLWGAVSAGRALNDELERTRNLGGDIAAHAAQARADALRLSGTSIPTMKPSEIVRLNRELSTQVGPEEADKLTEPLARSAWVLSHATGKDVGADAILNVYRAVEAHGDAFKIGPDGQKHFDPDGFMRAMNAAVAAITQGGGLVTPQDLRTGMRQAGPSMLSMPPEIAFPLIAEGTVQMSASRFGTAEMSLAQQFAGGVMTQRTAEALKNVHLLNEGDYKVERGGHVTLAQEAREKFSAMFQDPVKWVRDVLTPLVQKSGTSPFDMIVMLFGLFGRQTTQRVMADLFNNNPQFQRAIDNTAKVPSVDQQYSELQANNLTTNLKEFTTAWGALTEAMSDKGVALAIPILHGLTDALHWLTQEATEHPESTKALLGFTAAFAALLALGGAITICTVALGPFTAAFGTLIRILAGTETATAVTGITGLGAGITALGTILLTVAGATVVVTKAFEGLDAFLKHWQPGIFNDKGLHDIEKNGVARPWWWPGFLGGSSKGMPSGPNLNDYLPGHPRGANPEDGVSGIHKESFTPPPSRSAPIQVTSNTYLDGRQIARTVSEHQSRYASMAPSGTSAFDLRMSPLAPGQQVAA